jgi:hypothetical protein
MDTTTAGAIRRAAIVGMVGASLTAASGAIVQLVVQPSTTISDKNWSYPWSTTALVAVSIIFASLHVLVAIGLIGLRSSGATGSTGAGRWGLTLAIAGTVLLLAGELASIGIRDARTDDGNAIAVSLIFAAGIVLTAVGFLAAGRATLRAGTWDGWRRYMPLLTGIWSVVLLALNATKALPTGVGVYGVCLLAVFYALLTAPATESVVPARPPQPAVVDGRQP